MPLTIPPLTPEVWDDPEVIAAIEGGDLGRFLLGVRGARRARLNQDQVARMVGCGQAAISRLENGKVPATPLHRERCVDAVLTGLGVPPGLRRRWEG
jgi:hypothetical protein